MRPFTSHCYSLKQTLTLKRSIALILTLILQLFTTQAAADPLSDLTDRLNSFTTMTANFKQTLYAGSRNPAQTSRGSMALQKPGKFIWKTIQPNQQKLIANGNIAWIYDIDLEQATKTKIDSTNSDSPAVFLTGDVKSLPKRYVISKQNNHFVLKAKNKDDMFQRFTLTFKGDALIRMDVLTKLDQTSKFEFSKIKLNQKLPSKWFVFKPPKGVDVLENR